MFPLNHFSSIMYHALVNNSTEIGDEETSSKSFSGSIRHIWSLPKLLIIFLLTTAAITSLVTPSILLRSSIPDETVCRERAIRREWRTLKDSERIEYLRAVKCLHDLPSRLNKEGILSDDFPWVHFHVGNFGTLNTFCVIHYFPTPILLSHA